MADLTTWVRDQVAAHARDAHRDHDAHGIADCDAKRRVLDLCATVLGNPDQAPSASVELARQVVRTLAVPYVRHPR